MRVNIRSERCKQCELCAANCPKDAITFSQEINESGYRAAVIDHEKCISCGICYNMCPDGVFEVVNN